MSIQEIQAKSILRKHKKIDIVCFPVWHESYIWAACMIVFTVTGRAEKYRVEGEFGKDVEGNMNAPEILARELDPARKRKPFEPGFVILGGGVGDSYQSLDSRYQLSRKALELLLKFGHPVHVLTKIHSG